MKNNHLKNKISELTERVNKLPLPQLPSDARSKAVRSNKVTIQDFVNRLVIGSKLILTHKKSGLQYDREVTGISSSQISVKAKCYAGAIVLKNFTVSDDALQIESNDLVYKVVITH